MITVIVQNSAAFVGDLPEHLYYVTEMWWRDGHRCKADHYKGSAHITGRVVIKGEHILYLCFARDQVLTGTFVMDYSPKIANRRSGVYRCGRFFRDCGYNWAYTPPSRFGRPLADGLEAGGLYANWECDQPKDYLLEDSYVNNNRVLCGRPVFSTCEGCKYVECDRVSQYAEAPPSVADFEELTVAARIFFTGGANRYLFDFGTGTDEYFRLNLEALGGKPQLEAVHAGKTFTLSGSKPIPVQRWVRVRVELDGKRASLWLDKCRIAEGDFALSPRQVFIGDRTEGNFIGCRRTGGGFFEGRVGYFRIYRKVGRDFDSLKVPLPLTQQVSEEACARARKLSEAWKKQWEEKRKKLQKEKVPEPPEYKKLVEERDRLNKRKSQVLKELSEAREDLSEKGRQRAAECVRKLASIGARLEQLNEEFKAWRKKLQIRAPTHDGRGYNPHSGFAGGNVLKFQKALTFHSSADPDWRTPQEVRAKVPKKMKEWLERVRGY